MIGARRRRRPALAWLALAAIVTASLAAGASATQGPPPTPVPPKGSLSPFPSVLHTPADATSPPPVSAPSAVLADAVTGQLLYARAPLERRPIASLTKIMTALLVLERADLGEVVTVSPDAVFARDAYGASSTLGLKAGERLTVRDLLYGLMLQSANDAAVALAIHVSGSESAFVAAMNAKAKALGMTGTEFFSSNGLDDRGHSTARDLVILTRAALRSPVFAEIVDTKFRTITSLNGRERQVQNRDVMLWLYPGARGVKTGSTAAAGYCLVTIARRDGRRLIAVVLGAPADAFSDGASLLDFGFEAFEPHTFVSDGDDVGDVRIRGGVVPAVAGGTISGLVPSAAVAEADRGLAVDAGAAFPTIPGERIGTLRITLPGVTVGSAPLIAAPLPVPAASAAPWWARAGGAVGRALVDAVGGLLG